MRVLSLDRPLGSYRRAPLGSLLRIWPFFTSNRASNYLPLRAHLLEHKEEALHLIQQVFSRLDRSILLPEFLRELWPRNKESTARFPQGRSIFL